MGWATKSELSLRWQSRSCERWEFILQLHETLMWESWKANQNHHVFQQGFCVMILLFWSRSSTPVLLSWFCRDVSTAEARVALWANEGCSVLTWLSDISLPICGHSTQLCWRCLGDWKWQPKALGTEALENWPVAQAWAHYPSSLVFTFVYTCFLKTQPGPFIALCVLFGVERGTALQWLSCAWAHTHVLIIYTLLDFLFSLGLT